MSKKYHQSQTNDIIQLYDVDSYDSKKQTTNKDYCPISVKDEINKPGYNDFDNMSNTQLFLSKKNIYYMTHAFVTLNKANKANNEPLNNANKANNETNKLQRMIPNLMNEWAAKNKINNADGATGDIIENLEFLNNRFLKEYGYLYNISGTNTLNVFRIKDVVTDVCGRQYTKKYDEMLATDYHTLNLWRDNNKDTYANNAKFRDCNRIPVWQKSMNVRHYDLDNDGLHAAEFERASLDTQTRGYDMSNIVKGSTNYENYYYDNI